MKFLNFSYFFFAIISINVFSQQGWIQLNSGTNLNLNCEYFTDANTGYIGADSGKVLKTINGGTNWIILNTGTKRQIYSVQFVNQSTGFFGTMISGTSSKVLRTPNAGISWDTAFNGGGYAISFINATTGYSVRFPFGFTLTKTTNAGQTWDSIGIVPIPIGSVYNVFFLNEMTGYFCGNLYTLSFMIYNATIGRTTNGGMSWNAGGYGGTASS